MAIVFAIIYAVAHEETDKARIVSKVLKGTLN